MLRVWGTPGNEQIPFIPMEEKQRFATKGGNCDKCPFGGLRPLYSLKKVHLFQSAPGEMRSRSEKVPPWENELLAVSSVREVILAPGGYFLKGRKGGPNRISPELFLDGPA